MAIIKQKQKGEITMAEAILDLPKTLPEGGDINVFSQYVEQLAEAEHKPTTPLEQGNMRNPQILRHNDIPPETTDEPALATGTK